MKVADQDDFFCFDFILYSKLIRLTYERETLCIYSFVFIAEPQLMLTAGPGMMAPGYAPQGVYGAPPQGVYAPAAAAYQAYGM